MSFECEGCYREFATQHAVFQHMDALNHWAPRYHCETCDREFLSQNAAYQHMDAVMHWTPTFECDICVQKFHTQASANEHMNATNHWEHLYCRDCSKGFRNQNNLRQHLNSNIHRGTNVPCPFCKTAFVTASGLSHHLETGSCPQARGLTRETIYNAIKQRDPSGLVTMKLLTFPGATTENIATGAAWNGYGFECYLCHREFKSLQSLNQHVNSPVHSQKYYHCPNRSCPREFVSLAAFFNHLESESCNFVRFEKVQEQVHNFITGRQRLIGF